MRVGPFELLEFLFYLQKMWKVLIVSIILVVAVRAAPQGAEEEKHEPVICAHFR